MLSLIITAVLFQGQNRDVPHEIQLFAPTISAWLQQTNSSASLAIWPTPQLEGNPVERSRVPEEVLNQADAWVKLIMQSEWAPAGYRENVVPFKGFRGNDVLGDRYRLDGWTIQIVETLRQVCVTVLPPQGQRVQQGLSTENGTVFLSSVIRTVTRFPSEKVDHIVWEASLTEVPSGPAVLTAVGQCETGGVDSWYWQWWQEFHAWTDGSVANVVFEKRIGAPSAFGGATEQRVADRRFRDR
jgi:hypothetical protein